MLTLDRTSFAKAYGTQTQRFQLFTGVMKARDEIESPVEDFKKCIDGLSGQRASVSPAIQKTTTSAVLPLGWKHIGFSKPSEAASRSIHLGAPRKIKLPRLPLSGGTSQQNGSHACLARNLAMARGALGEEKKDIDQV